MNFFKTLIDTIIEIESQFEGQLQSGEQKKEKVIDITNKLVDIPVIPEVLERKIFNLIVDLIVFIFNEYKLFDQKQ